MHPPGKRVALLLIAVCAVPAAAQDVPVIAGNPYARKRAEAGPKIKVDPVLVHAVVDKVVDCYRREQEAPMSKEDAGLLREYGADVVRELAAGFAETGCTVGERASPTCLEQLVDLDCAKLAEPIVAAGWDRNLAPQARVQVADYAGMLARREGRCGGNEGEEAQIVTGVRGDRLATLIESQIVSGQCELFPDRLTKCADELENVSCERIMALNERGELQMACNVLHCVRPGAAAKPDE
jgi:hypothetical protein